ncbi:MAG: methyltransferase domain-containing protein [Bdellovibrionota bacterium]
MNNSTPNDKAWYRHWFNQEYLEVYGHRSDEAAIKEAKFIESSLDLTSKDTLLDIACGNGRHLKYFISQGYQIYGADLSFDLLKVANSPERASGRVARHDMRWPCFKQRSFDAVFSIFTSFGYFESDAEHLSQLYEVNKLLKKDGKFFFDFLNLEYALQNLIPESSKDTSLGKVVEKRAYDQNTRRIIKTIELVEKQKSFTESVRAYSFKEIENMFLDAGLALVNVYGDFSGSDYNQASSERLIISAKRYL